MLTVTHSGRLGDILWAAPSMRAIAAIHGPVHLHVPGEFKGLGSILLQQPYIAEFSFDDGWSATPGDGWRAPQHPEAVHIGYKGWPTLGLPYETYRIACEFLENEIAPLDLETPWIAVEPFDYSEIVAGWTETWFELKVGLMTLLDSHWSISIMVPRNGRWCKETRRLSIDGCDIDFAARCIQAAKGFIGDCSALHVLAVAMGKPCVIVEPMEARLNPIFWPLGMDGPRIYCVKGGDGKPTFDARHTAETLERVLQGVTA